MLRLADDHKRAKELASVLATKSWVKEVAPTETNIVIFTLQNGLNDQVFIEKMKQKNILLSSMGQGKLRFVTHLDYRQVMHEYVLEVLEKFQF
jgi:threonine aldolase